MSVLFSLTCYVLEPLCKAHEVHIYFASRSTCRHSLCIGHDQCYNPLRFRCSMLSKGIPNLRGAPKCT